jgi:hypothetical protein
MEQLHSAVIVIILIVLISLLAHTLKKKVDENINSLKEMDLKYKNKTLK